MNETGDLDALAAEYVLGTLDTAERSQVQALLGADEGLRAKVRVWERRLSELHLMVEPVDPDGQIWERIKAKIPAVTPSEEIKPPEPVAEPPKPAEAAEDATPTGVFDDPPEAATATAAAEAVPTRALESILASVTAATSVLTSPLTPSPAAEKAPISPPVVATPAPAPDRVVPAARVEAEANEHVIRGRLRRWRALTLVLALIVLGIAGLVAMWRFAPDKVPAALQPVALMRAAGIAVPSAGPPRRPAPPESQFDE